MKRMPTIDDARELDRRYGLRGVVIVFHDGDTGGYVSWGDTRAECSWMRRVGNRCFDALMQMWAER